jgi:hypothetical protein
MSGISEQQPFGVWPIIDAIPENTPGIQELAIETGLVEMDARDLKAHAAELSGAIDDEDVQADALGALMDRQAERAAGNRSIDFPFGG